MLKRAQRVFQGCENLQKLNDRVTATSFLTAVNEWPFGLHLLKKVEWLSIPHSSFQLCVKYLRPFLASSETLLGIYTKLSQLFQAWSPIFSITSPLLIKSPLLALNQFFLLFPFNTLSLYGKLIFQKWPCFLCCYILLHRPLHSLWPLLLSFWSFLIILMYLLSNQHLSASITSVVAPNERQHWTSLASSHVYICPLSHGSLHNLVAWCPRPSSAFSTSCHP